MSKKKVETCKGYRKIPCQDDSKSGEPNYNITAIYRREFYPQEGCGMRIIPVCSACAKYLFEHPEELRTAKEVLIVSSDSRFLIKTDFREGGSDLPHMIFSTLKKV